LDLKFDDVRNFKFVGYYIESAFPQT